MRAIIVDQTLLLSQLYLISIGVKKYTVKSWKTKYKNHWIEVDSRFYFAYKAIPKTTRNKIHLPSENLLIKEFSKINQYETVFEKLTHARLFKYSEYRQMYQSDQSLTSEKATRFAQLHAVFQTIIDLKEHEGFRELRILYEAFNNLYPGKYRSKHALSNAIRKAMCDGVMNVALDKRAFGNNVEQNSKKFSPLQKFWIANLVGHPAKFSNTKIHEKLCQACEETQHHKPSLSWVKKWRLQLLKNPELYNSRYGSQQTNKVMPFASLKHGVHANDQWQMDGWMLPFWGHKFQRFVLVRLIDSSSKKIVGYSFGPSEDSVLIMDAIRDAINCTGIIPFEVLTDNHSFNETQQAKNLIKLFNKKGSRWTVTQNPQYKAIIERYNQHLDLLCKEYYGYIGQGIRSKSIEAITKPELLTEYSKNFLSVEEIRGIAIAIVDTYNKTALKCGKSPNELYTENANPHPIEANVFDRAELLIMQAEKKVCRGQITIMRGPVKHEFQFPAEYFQDVNGSTVIVKYDNLSDGIYVFNKKSGEPITFLPPKDTIHGVKVNQSNEDIEALYRNKGRITGIKTKGRKQLEEIADKAFVIDPDAHHRLNKLTTPKNVLQQLEKDAHLRQTAESKGLKMHLLDVPERVYTTCTTALQPKEKKQNPFSAKNNTIGIINPLKDIDSD